MTDNQWKVLQRYPRPWRASESKGGKVFIYAYGQGQPIFTMHVAKWNSTDREALLSMIAEAVNCLDELDVSK